MWYRNIVDMDHLVGKTIKEVEGLEEGSRKVHIYTECGNHYMFYHDQDCCECVDLYDFDGDAEDIIGGAVVSSEEVSNFDVPDHKYGDDSHTWTFYKIETTKGGLWLRWLGESNGYYSESVDFVWVNKPSDR